MLFKDKLHLVVIPESSFNYLVETIPDKALVKCLKHSSQVRFTSIYIAVNAATCEKIIDFLQKQLVRSGLKNNSEPDDFGLYLENSLMNSEEISTADLL